jgi:hypothetical protein
MDTRLILQITLGVLLALILVVGGLITYELTRDASTQVVERVVEKEADEKEKENPWASEANRKAAIKLVKRQTVEGMPEEEGDEEEATEATTVADILDDAKFVKEKLKITSAKPSGWEATWWGETKYGPQYYLVRYAFEDANIRIGPAWLVDLKGQKVVPKNVLARVAQTPKKGVESDYYDKAQQVVAAITNHRFESGVNLGGALLLYFKERAESSDEDTILGWTIDHDRGNKFDAYFQWVEEGSPTYAEFKFDYDRKALRAINLQAADIMRAGEEFDQKNPVDIMPQEFDSKKKRFVDGACKKMPRHPGCRSLVHVLSNDALIESLEWMLTAQAKTREEFEVCKSKGNCRFMPQKKDKSVYRILYVYNLEKKDKFDRRHVDEEWACKHSLKAGDKKKSDDWAFKGNCMAWDIDVKSGEITPVDQTSTLAYRAIHPRS